MEKIKIKISKDTLEASCDLWRMVFEAIPMTREQMKNKSIAHQVLKKLRKKQIDSANKEDRFTMSFEVHEAIVFNELLRPNLDNWATIYQQALLYRVIDEIHQITA